MRSAALRVGFIGTGRISDLHAAEYLQNPAARIVGLCDRDVVLAERRAAEWGLEEVRFFDDPDELLARNDVDLVEILLPHHLHLPVALKAIEAGKIVSLQKPMCTSAEEADQLVETVSRSGLPFRVFENFIFYPPVVKARQLVDAGAIGTPLSVRIKSNSGISQTAWAVPAGATRWRQNRTESGGGPLVFDDGHHKFALAWHFMGNPTEVHAFLGSTRMHRPSSPSAFRTIGLAAWKSSIPLEWRSTPGIMHRMTAWKSLAPREYSGSMVDMADWPTRRHSSCTGTVP